MSINTWYKCITPGDLDQLVRDTSQDLDAPTKYLYPDDEDEDYERPEPGLWTERNWFGLHSLLTYGEWAKQPLLGESIAGGTPLGDDYCIGPIRYFRAEQVRDISLALETVDEKALEATCDPVALNTAQVEPVGEWREGDFVYLWLRHEVA